MANTTIALKKSSTPAAIPAALANGELALNFADGKLYYKNATGQIVVFTSTGNSYGIANVDNTLILSGTGNDVLNFRSGNNISLSACTVTKTIVINGTAASVTVPVSTVAPSSPTANSLWWNSNLGRLFIYYNDGDSSQWVEAEPSGGTPNGNVVIQATNAYDQANAAYLQANGAYINANTAANSANAYTVTVGAASNTWANTKLANTSGTYFAGNFFIPSGSTLGIGSPEVTAPLTISLNNTVSVTLAGALIDADGSSNSYLQTTIRNANTSQGASSDFVATTDDGTDSNNYIDLGINNSGFSSPNWTISGARDGYLYVQDTNLSIGSANVGSATKFVNFFLGGTLAADEVMRLQDSAGGANVGIGRTNPAYKLDVNGAANISSFMLVSGNVGIGTSAVSSRLTVGSGIGTAGGAGLKLVAGSTLATAEEGAFEFSNTDNVLYFTSNTTQGRYIVPATQYYRLTANTAAIGPGITDVFGASSSIPLVTNGVYEIEIELWFLKTTAGTVTWTLTNSTTVTNMDVNLLMSSSAGFTSNASASVVSTGSITFQTAAASAFAATASLTTAVSHWAKFKIILENGASTSLRLRATSSAGSITPLRGSYWKATRISSTNTGTYPA